MPTTRSATTKQAKLEDLVDDDSKSKRKASQGVGRKDQRSKQQTASASTKTPAKRKLSATESTPSGNRKKQQHISSSNVEQLEKPIVINRAPVLQLWGAVVAHFVHPGLSWPACLSIGNAISTLCAISKGKAIGMIEPKDKDESEDRKEQESKEQQGTKECPVMGFPLHLKDDAVIMSGKPKKFSEAALQGKFGQDQYEVAKKAMTDALQSWSGDEDELDKKAFHMYEQFRPNVATGQQGWGRKGELNLHEIATVVKKPQR